MLASREAIYSAVFAIFSGASNFKTKGRRLKTWSDVDAERQPALFMAQGSEVATRTKGLPTKWTLSATLYLYAHTRRDEDPIGPVINPLLDSITQLVETKALPDGSRRALLTGETNTLGVPGVSHCWIEGDIKTDEGALGSQGVAIIPVSILVA